MSIVLMARELSEDSQFPIIDRDLVKATKYAFLWATKDVNQIHDSKLFWVFMEMNLRIGMNYKSRLSPPVYNNLQIFVEFKADLHNIYIRAHKDPAKKWIELPFVSMDDVIFNLLETWPLEWRTPNIVAIEKSVSQRKKEEAKLHMAQLAKKRRKEAMT